MSAVDAGSRTLAGRRALITGAASGIGCATAEMFVAEGATVAMLDRDEAALASQAGRIGGFAAVADVTDEVAVNAAVAAAADHLGGLDTVVNAAGVSLLQPFAATTPEIWQQTMAVNLGGPYLVCRAALPWLTAAGGGSIVNIASGAGLRPIPDSAAYAASKAGLIMFGKALAVELAPAGIRVNTVCPGIVDTPMMRSALDPSLDEAEARRRVVDRYLIRRMAAPREIALAVRYLSSAEAAYVTGTTLPVDGGRTLH
mgnify:CR=1 FL=1